jgi:threonine dehydrogenase-like Zn-dependent dehydrogenase
MRATVMHGAGDVRIEEVADARLIEPTDALIRVTRACICGSDLWPYKSMEPTDGGRPMGHEAIGVVEEVGAEVSTVKAGDLVVILGRHQERTDLARELGATDVVAERGAEGVERVRELTDGFGAHSVLECVGLDQSTRTAIEIARPGGAIGRVGVPQSEPMPGGQASFYGNVTIGGGPAPVRAYIEELLPDILDGTIEPGRVFDRTVDLDGVPDGYRAMDEREALKVMVEP